MSVGQINLISHVSFDLIWLVKLQQVHCQFPCMIRIWVHYDRYSERAVSVVSLKIPVVVNSMKQCQYNIRMDWQTRYGRNGYCMVCIYHLQHHLQPTYYIIHQIYFIAGWLTVHADSDTSCSNFHVYEKKEVRAVFSRDGVKGEMRFTQVNPYSVTKVNITLKVRLVIISSLMESYLLLQCYIIL